MDYLKEYPQGRIIEDGQYKLLGGVIIKPSDIKKGSTWKGTGNITVKVYKVETMSCKDGSEWSEIHYCWNENGKIATHSKDSFAFQCRYCMVLE
jgi:hypothetical protein